MLLVFNFIQYTNAGSAKRMALTPAKRRVTVHFRKGDDDLVDDQMIIVQWVYHKIRWMYPPHSSSLSKTYVYLHLPYKFTKFTIQNSSPQSVWTLNTSPHDPGQPPNQGEAAKLGQVAMRTVGTKSSCRTITKPSLEIIQIHLG